MPDLKERYTAAKQALFQRAYAELNEMQREAVFTVNGPLLVLAGAGSGKTTVLVQRIVHIIKYGDAYYDRRTPVGLDEAKVASLEAAASLSSEEIENILPEFISDPCPPWRMLAITFTNKAASEIRERLAASLGDPSAATEIWAGTFHAMCMRILRANAAEAGLAPGFTVYDADDTKKAIRETMKALSIDEKMLSLKAVVNKISRSKEKLQTPEMFSAEATGGDYRLQLISKIYTAYQSRLAASNAVDFDDIIMKTVILLRTNQEILNRYSERFRYVSVDEFQDTNEAQFVLISLLSSRHRNLMAVGDDDQSIYRFRGATVENILGFDKKFSDSKVIKLEQNYRSTQNILSAANSVISHNEGRRGKSLWTSNGSGEKIYIRKLENQDTEARFIAETVNRMVSREGRAYRDFAVLYRTNAQSNAIETVFAKSGMPYRVLGGTRFSDRKEIRDIVAYLQLINNHSDRERLLRIINEPRRKIGDKTLEGISILAEEQGCSMFGIIEHADRYPVLSRSFGVLLGFASLINGLTEFTETASLDALVRETLERSGYRNMLIEEGPEGRERLDNLDEFVSGIIEYINRSETPTLTGFLEENALVADVDRYDENADAVVLMTVHSAKGLEFPVVFLPGMEDGLFPSAQSQYDPDEFEEERRLAYVAITRAKKALYLLNVGSRMIYGRTMPGVPSVFIREIPEELVDIQEARPKTRQTNTGKIYFTGDNYANQESDLTVAKKPTAPSLKNLESFEEGDIVEHMSFGRGEVISVKKMGSDILYEIVFERVGTKKLMATYARLKKAKL